MLSGKNLIWSLDQRHKNIFNNLTTFLPLHSYFPSSLPHHFQLLIETTFLNWCIHWSMMLMMEQVAWNFLH